MKQLLLTFIILGLVSLSFAIEHRIKFADEETLQIRNGKEVPSTEQNLSGTTNFIKDRSNKQIQKQKITEEQETSCLKSKWIFRKSLNRWGRRLISGNELGTGGRDSGSVAYFSGKVPFTSDYFKPTHHPPKNN